MLGSGVEEMESAKHLGSAMELVKDQWQAQPSGLSIWTLLADLRSSGVGCFVGGVYTGVVAYADDLMLLAPNRMAAQKMLSICENFAKDFAQKYNKSLAIDLGKDFAQKIAYIWPY